MRIVFDENSPRAIARAMQHLSIACEDADSIEEVLHALDIVAQGTLDVPLIQAVATGPSKAALITTDKAMRTRAHERKAFQDTGCIGIVLLGEWCHASLFDRARLTLFWWTMWVRTLKGARPGTLWRCPYVTRPKPLQPF